jgi:hypothetical protein
MLPLDNEIIVIQYFNLKAKIIHEVALDFIAIDIRNWLSLSCDFLHEMKE